MIPGNPSEATRAVLQEATQIARDFSHEQVEPEHLLLALLTCDDAVAGRLFGHTELDAIREELESRLTPGTEFITRGKLLPSPVAQRVLREAADLADRGFLEPRHLLAGLLRVENTIAASALEKLGVVEETTFGHDPLQQPGRINGTNEGLVRTIIDSTAELPYRETADDDRLYLPRREGWTAHVKSGWEKEYCYQKNPGEDYFHLLLSGEIYLQRGDEKYCLNCARRMGLVTSDRLYWQRRPRKQTQA